MKNWWKINFFCKKKEIRKLHNIIYIGKSLRKEKMDEEKNIIPLKFDLMFKKVFGDSKDQMPLKNWRAIKLFFRWKTRDAN